MKDKHTIKSWNLIWNVESRWILKGLTRIRWRKCIRLSYSCDPFWSHLFNLFNSLAAQDFHWRINIYVYSWRQHDLDKINHSWGWLEISGDNCISINKYVNEKLDFTWQAVEELMVTFCSRQVFAFNRYHLFNNKSITFVFQRGKKINFYLLLFNLINSYISISISKWLFLNTHTFSYQNYCFLHLFYSWAFKSFFNCISDLNYTCNVFLKEILKSK